MNDYEIELMENGDIVIRTVGDSAINIHSPSINVVSGSDIENVTQWIYSHLSAVDTSYTESTIAYWAAGAYNEPTISYNNSTQDDYDGYGEFGYDPISPYTTHGLNDIAAMDDDDDDCCGDPNCDMCHEDRSVDVDLLTAVFDDLIEDGFPDHIKVTVIIRDEQEDEDVVLSNDDLGAAQWAIEKKKA